MSSKFMSPLFLLAFVGCGDGFVTQSNSQTNPSPASTETLDGTSENLSDSISTPESLGRALLESVAADDIEAFEALIPSQKALVDAVRQSDVYKRYAKRQRKSTDELVAEINDDENYNQVTETARRSWRRVRDKLKELGEPLATIEFVSVKHDDIVEKHGFMSSKITTIFQVADNKYHFTNRCAIFGDQWMLNGGPTWRGGFNPDKDEVD